MDNPNFPAMVNFAIFKFNVIIVKKGKQEIKS